MRSIKRNIRIKKNSEGKRYYKPLKYPDIPLSPNDIYITTTIGDRLDNLAQQFYGNPHLWWFIAQTNNISTINVPAGISLRIPISTKDASGN